MIKKEIIFYFVRKVALSLPKEMQKKLKNARVVVNEDMLYFDAEERKWETLGAWHPKTRVIEFFLQSIRAYIGGERNVYGALRKVESIVEHELLHAAGLDHDEINKYREEKKK